MTSCLTRVLTLKGNLGKRTDLTVAFEEKKPRVYKLIYRNIPTEERKNEKILLMNGRL